MSGQAYRATIRAGLAGRVAAAQAALLGLSTTITWANVDVAAGSTDAALRPSLLIALERISSALAALEFDLRTLDVDSDTRRSFALVVHAFVDVVAELVDAFAGADVALVAAIGQRFVVAADLLKKALASLPVPSVAPTTGSS